MSALQMVLRGASVCFGTAWALRDVELAIRRGESVAIVGANGSGKSTLLRALHGLMPLSSGQREVNGSLREAMVFQRPFMLRRSARANVDLGLWLAGVPRAERAHRTTEAMHLVGLSDVAQRPGHLLSIGQQQRLALARAWALRPDVVFLDEPTANLDPTAKREVEALIARFSQRGITTVMSTHNLGQVKRLASRVVYLEGGRVLADVATERFFNGEMPHEAQLFLRAELPWA